MSFTGSFILHSHIRICLKTHVLPCAGSPLFHLFMSTELCGEWEDWEDKAAGSVIL